MEENIYSLEPSEKNYVVNITNNIRVIHGWSLWACPDAPHFSLEPSEKNYVVNITKNIRVISHGWS